MKNKVSFLSDKEVIKRFALDKENCEHFSTTGFEVAAVIEGNLEINGNLDEEWIEEFITENDGEIDFPLLIAVNGDCIVQGSVKMDMPSTWLHIAGNLTATNLVTNEDEVYVKQNATITQCIATTYEGSIIIDGITSSPYILNYTGTITAKPTEDTLVLGLEEYALSSGKHIVNLKGSIIPELVESDGSIDTDVFLTYLENDGNPLAIAPEQIVAQNVTKDPINTKAIPAFDEKMLKTVLSMFGKEKSTGTQIANRLAITSPELTTYLDYLATHKLPSFKHKTFLEPQQLSISKIFKKDDAVAAFKSFFCAATTIFSTNSVRFLASHTATVDDYSSVYRQFIDELGFQETEEFYSITTLLLKELLLLKNNDEIELSESDGILVEKLTTTFASSTAKDIIPEILNPSYLARRTHWLINLFLDIPRELSVNQMILNAPNYEVYLQEKKYIKEHKHIAAYWMLHFLIVGEPEIAQEIYNSSNHQTHIIIDEIVSILDKGRSNPDWWNVEKMTEKCLLIQYSPKCAEYLSVKKRNSINTLIKKRNESTLEAKNALKRIKKDKNVWEQYQLLKKNSNLYDYQFTQRFSKSRKNYVIGITKQMNDDWRVFLKDEIRRTVFATDEASAIGSLQAYASLCNSYREFSDTVLQDVTVFFGDLKIEDLLYGIELFIDEPAAVDELIRYAKKYVQNINSTNTYTQTAFFMLLEHNKEEVKPYVTQMFEVVALNKNHNLGYTANVLLYLHKNNLLEAKDGAYKFIFEKKIGKTDDSPLLSLILEPYVLMVGKSAYADVKKLFLDYYERKEFDFACQVMRGWLLIGTEEVYAYCSELIEYLCAIEEPYNNDKVYSVSAICRGIQKARLSQFKNSVEKLSKKKKFRNDQFKIPIENMYKEVLSGL